MNKCKRCNKNILKPMNMSNRRYDEIKYCSMFCYLESKKLVNECKNCGKDIVTTHNSNKIFCDKDCRSEWNEKQKTKCEFCGEQLELDTPLRFGRKKYCSHNCFESDYGKGFIRYCERCHLPIYNRCGNHKEYKLIRKHKKCQPYIDANNN